MTLRDIGLPIIIVPGLGGSEPEHWQSQFEIALLRATRISGVDWDRPLLSVWMEELLRTIERQPDSILVAHSLGCALIAHAASRHRYLAVSGAMLVAPADIDESPVVPRSLQSFASVPRQPLPFPSILVASANDPYMTANRAWTFASAWGAQFVDTGACGHINVASGFGHWPEGQQILHDFASRLEAPISLSSQPLPHQPERI